MPSPRPEVACRVCGARRPVFLCRTFNEHSATRWLDNFRCSECGSVFIGTDLPRGELAQAYASMDEAAYYRETADTSAAKFRAAANDLAQAVASSAAILDIGGGNGAFVRALKARGFSDLSLHEIPGGGLPDLSGVVRAVYRDIDYVTVPAAAFDAVTLMDVMEHVPDPGATLAAVRRLLKPGGIVYLHTPVVTVLDRVMHVLLKLPLVRGFASAWQRARTSVFHLQNYSPRALRLLMQRHGFEIVRLDCINELSWPIERYVRVYLVERRGLPSALAPLVVLLARPFVRSRLHANKAVLLARSQ